MAPTTRSAAVPKMPVSDTAVKAKTGRTWAQWCTILDRAKAQSMSHREVVTLLHEKFGVAEWWQQMVTVGYERARGRRAVNQTSQGFATSVSRTIASSAARAHRAWTDAPLRAAWLPGQRFAVRTASPGKTIRLTWPDETKVEVRITPRTASKCVVEVTHTGLAGTAAVRGAKSFWGARLDALRDVLED